VESGAYPYISTVPVPIGSGGEALYEFNPGPDAVGSFCVDVTVDSVPVFGGESAEERCRQWAGVFTLQPAA